ncbi:MAG: hypothetical protein KBT27_13020 [Prevotellaceae bacterium]|nr:hypothetical protein [Candidatus Faecinaster equi]
MKYPHYISNAPKGIDLFQGKSQERLKCAIAQHILLTDAEKNAGIARIIGVEGKWGSGKSNVISMLKDSAELSSYYLFTYDAWGNQEDLQRRSILEMLTRELIDRKILTGKTKMLFFDPKDGSEPKEKDCSWEEKLSALLSRKSYTRDITVPSLQTSTKWFLLMIVITGLLIPILDIICQDSWNWYWQLAIAFSAFFPLLVFALWMFCTKQSWKEMFAMYETGSRNDTTSYVISEEEPSVSEFKNWMHDISNSIGEKRLILVFDNMDRLASDKVHQLWSSIHTFFADVDKSYNNIWCIIPYDEEHLAEAFWEEDDDKRNIGLLKNFLDKTFPVSFRIPEPVVSDYKDIVNVLLDEAFSDTISKDSKDKVNRCYRVIQPKPNVREIISFINRLVSLKQIWGSAISHLSMAVYVLQEDNILNTPTTSVIDQDGIIKSIRTTTETYVIERNYEKSFGKLLSVEDQDKLQKDIAALVYGISPDDAYQIMIKRALENCFILEDNTDDITRYTSDIHFASILDEVVTDIDLVHYERMVKKLSILDKNSLSQNVKLTLTNLWDRIALRYERTQLFDKEYGDADGIILLHANDELRISCAKAYYKRLVRNKESKGDFVYLQLEKLFSEPFAKDWNIETICEPHSLSPDNFMLYVNESGKNFEKYPISVKNSELNEFLVSKVGKDFPYYPELEILCSYSNFDFSLIKDKVISMLSEEKASAQEADVLIHIQRVLLGRFANTSLSETYISKLWSEVQGKPSEAYYPEIYSLKAASSVEQLSHDETHINYIKEKLLFYKSTADILQLACQHSNIYYLMNVCKAMITEFIHDDNPKYDEFLKNWQLIVDTTSVSRKNIIEFAQSWGYNSIPESVQLESIKTIFTDTAWISELIETCTSLADKLLKKATSELTERPAAEFANGMNHSNTYWDKMLKLLINTSYISESNLGSLSALTATLLDNIARTGRTEDETWCRLIEKTPYKLISTEVSSIRNNILNEVANYKMTPSKFVQLHNWLEYSGINEDSHCTDSANQILAKVINDSSCQEIIMLNKKYYQPIISRTRESASNLHAAIKDIENSNPNTEFAKYLIGIVNYLDENKKEE